MDGIVGSSNLSYHFDEAIATFSVPALSGFGLKSGVLLISSGGVGSSLAEGLERKEPNARDMFPRPRRERDFVAPHWPRSSIACFTTRNKRRPSRIPQLIINPVSIPDVRTHVTIVTQGDRRKWMRERA